MTPASSWPTDPTYDTVTAYTALGPDRVQDDPADGGLPLGLRDDIRLHEGHRDGGPIGGGTGTASGTELRLLITVPRAAG